MKVHTKCVCYNMVFLPFLLFFFNHLSFYQGYFCLVLHTLSNPLHKVLAVVKLSLLPFQKIPELGAVFQLSRFNK